VPPDRLKFYNTFGQNVVSSAVAAIDDSVEELTGRTCAEALRAEIESIIVGAWHRHSEDMETTFKTGVSTPDLLQHSLLAAARVSNAIEDSIGQPVINELGVSITQVVSNALVNLTEALSKIYRDTIIDLRYSPNDPRFGRP